jgi:hypothetical protein
MIWSYDLESGHDVANDTDGVHDVASALQSIPLTIMLPISLLPDGEDAEHAQQDAEDVRDVDTLEWIHHLVS